jgi:eukaryotic-like serine/threonine-protein kinase
MAEGRSGSRGAVPIALGSAGGGTEEGREFFQSRVALFGGWVALISGTFYAAYWFLTLSLAPPAQLPNAPIGDPNFYHLAATVVAGALWVLVRPRVQLPMRALEWLEAIGTLLMCACFALMGIAFAQAHAGIGQDPMHGIFAGLSADSYVLLIRAVAVPSTPVRTLVVSTVAMLPMVTISAFALTGARVPDIDVFPPIDIITWSIAGVAMSVVASRVIFGLRTEVDKVRRLGQYTLEGKIGEGGMGVVYRASHAMLRRPTAIKILRPEIASEDALRRFEREVLLTASLSHPSTVAIFDYGRTPQGMFYYAMEYLDGLNLEQLVSKYGRQPPARVAHILRQVCGALAEAHAVGLIHRDVKPANIILSERGGLPDVAKVVDFGLVKSFDQVASRPDLDVTSVNLIVGTPLYMAPEAIGGNAPLDGRCDLYALGAVGYFLLTGEPVFQAKSQVEIFAHHLHTPPDPPSVRTGAYVPDDLERIVLRCLAKKPGDRYESAKALQHALDQCVEHTPWDSDLASQWWAAFKSGAPAAPLTTGGQQTIAIDITRRVARA